MHLRLLTCEFPGSRRTHTAFSREIVAWIPFSTVATHKGIYIVAADESASRTAAHSSPQVSLREGFVLGSVVADELKLRCGSLSTLSSLVPLVRYLDGRFLPLPNLGSNPSPYGIMVAYDHASVTVTPRSLHHPLGHAAYGTTKVAVRAISKTFSPHATCIGSYYPSVVCYNILVFFACPTSGDEWNDITVHLESKKQSCCRSMVSRSVTNKYALSTTTLGLGKGRQVGLVMTDLLIITLQL
jgi:hypothetical protein